MLDKYRYLLFAESKVSVNTQSTSLLLLSICLGLILNRGIWCFVPEQRLGPSAEMVMIDRMFIQEEKIALSQDKILAKERPGMLCFHGFTWFCSCLQLT